jgi:precorrin-6A/cobalt-precorrin-6A reductase
MRRILILGGTAEARRLAARLAPRKDLAVTLSLAGRTAAPAAQPVPVRIGGFGGAEGLAHYLTVESIDALIDATHPYAATISENAVRAAERANVAHLALHRPPWLCHPGDRWIEVVDVAGAVGALGKAPRRVFVALGRNELAPFVGAPQHHYLIRSVDPIDPPLPVPHAAYITGRGPFDEADERALMMRARIEVVIAKNSGGDASYGKIAAARALGLPVIMLRRPALPCAPSIETRVETIDDVLAWLDHAVTFSTARGV